MDNFSKNDLDYILRQHVGQLPPNYVSYGFTSGGDLLIVQTEQAKRALREFGKKAEKYKVVWFFHLDSSERQKNSSLRRRYCADEISVSLVSADMAGRLKSRDLSPTNMIVFKRMKISDLSPMQFQLSLQELLEWNVCWGGRKIYKMADFAWLKDQDRSFSWVDSLDSHFVGRELRVGAHANLRSELTQLIRKGDSIYHWSPSQERFVGHSRVASGCICESGDFLVHLENFTLTTDCLDSDFLGGKSEEIFGKLSRNIVSMPDKPLFSPFHAQSQKLTLLPNTISVMPEEIVEIIWVRLLFDMNKGRGFCELSVAVEQA
jgi:hypothetical protein